MGLDIGAQNCYGNAPFELAIQHDNEAAVETLLDLGAEIDAIDYQGDTALLDAVNFNSERSVRIPLSRSADYSIVNFAGDTILHSASHPKDLNIVSLLLGANLVGIDPNARNNASKMALELALAHRPRPECFIEMFRARAVRHQ